jgi:glycosyltransferase involved in cell wall biosynthesis
LLPEGLQKLAYPAIMPNLKRNPLLIHQLPPFLLAEYVAALRIVKSMDANLIYAHWVMPQGLVAWRIKRKLGVPYVLQNHSSDLTVFSKAGTIGQRLAQAVLREAAHFFCVNQLQRDYAISLMPADERDAFADRVTVLPMGISGEIQCRETEASDFDVATIARLSSKKGLDFLIEAAEQLAVRGVRPRIGIAGDGEDRAELEARVRNADITFTGFLVGEEKARFLASARTFVFPAKASEGDVEGLPVALLEALGRGKPVLASRDTNIETLPEWPVIRDAVTFVADPSDISALAEGLERLLGADTDRGRAVASTIARYRWDRLIGDYLKAIISAL